MASMGAERRAGGRVPKHAEGDLMGPLLLDRIVAVVEGLAGTRTRKGRCGNPKQACRVGSSTKKWPSAVQTAVAMHTQHIETCDTNWPNLTGIVGGHGLALVNMEMSIVKRMMLHTTIQLPPPHPPLPPTIAQVVF